MPYVPGGWAMAIRAIGFRLRLSKRESIREFALKHSNHRSFCSWLEPCASLFQRTLFDLSQDEEE